MEELSVEQKAKRYDEALEKARQIHDADRVSGIELTTCEEIFPELTESEDERIRKAIYLFVEAYGTHSQYATQEDMLAWLEAQGEHAKFRESIQIGDKVTRNEDGVLVNLSQLKRIAKPAENKGKHNMGISETTKKKLEDNLNEALEKETPESWNEFLDEQGEQNFAWSEEDESMLNQTLFYLGAYKNGCSGLPVLYMNKCISWLKFLKERVQSKQEWSEEDEKMFEHIIAKATLHFSSINYLDEEEINFLKSLRPQSQWKPSDEQMDALHYVTNFDYGGHKAILVSLYEQLKKL